MIAKYVESTAKGQSASRLLIVPTRRSATRLGDATVAVLKEGPYTGPVGFESLRSSSRRLVWAKLKLLSNSRPGDSRLVALDVVSRGRPGTGGV